MAPRSIMKKLLHLVVIILVTHPCQSTQADIWVDSIGGNDANTGSSPGAAIQSIGALNKTAISPGSTVYFRRGGVWKETLRAPSSGSENAPITFTAYGDGPPPLFDGLTQITPWKKAKQLSEANGRQIWYTSSREYVWWLMVMEANNRMIRLGLGGGGNSEQTITSLENHQYAIVSNTADHGNWAFYLRYDEGSPSSKDVSIYGVKDTTNGGLETLIDTNRKNHLVFDGLELRGAAASHSTPAFLIRDSKHITLQNSEIYFSKIGVSTRREKQMYSAHDCLISKNEIHDNVENGIYFLKSSSRNTISNNNVHHNYNKGPGDIVGDNLAIGIQGTADSPPTSNIIEYNSVHHNGSEYAFDNDDLFDNSISLYQVTNTIVRYNDIYKNHQGAYYASFKSNNVSFLYNRVWSNFAKNVRFIFLGTGSGSGLANNTIYGNTLVATTIPPYNLNSWRLISNDAQHYATFKNNIVARNLLVSYTNYPVFLFTNLNPGKPPAIDSNIYFDNASLDSTSNPQPLWFDRKSNSNSSHITLESWKAGTSFDAQSMDANPMFRNPEAEDFSIPPSSIAVDKGDLNPLKLNVDLKVDINGNYLVGDPDIGALESVLESSKRLSKNSIESNPRPPSVPSIK